MYKNHFTLDTKPCTGKSPPHNNCKEVWSIKRKEIENETRLRYQRGTHQIVRGNIKIKQN
jgi:hypothetical protein